jgi:hypothetical protein
MEVYRVWHGTTWFIEGDLSQFFDRLDHRILIGILAEKIHDQRLLRLINGLLQAGYLENWRFNATLSGVPQGSIVSPVLANLYLNRFDQWVETTLIPAYTRGAKRHANPAYAVTNVRAHWLRKHGRYKQAKALRRWAKAMPSVDPYDPDYRRLRYVRYADDWLLGFAGPRAEAKAIKHQVTRFLREQLKLDLSAPKTLITHARTQAAHFLGYEVSVLQEDTARDRTGRRLINGVIGLTVSPAVVRAKCKPYLFHSRPIHRAERLHDTVFSIVEQYQAEFRGAVEFYRLAYNVHRFTRLKWVMEQSLTKTLAHKLQISVPKVYERFGALLQTPDGTYKGLRVVVERANKPPLVATWGGIPLKRDLQATLDDEPPHVWNTRTDLEQRLLADTCELCGSHQHVEVHHIRALRDLRKRGRADKPAWVRAMATRRRKTLVVCRTCHMDIQHGRPLRRVRAA